MTAQTPEVTSTPTLSVPPSAAPAAPAAALSFSDFDIRKEIQQALTKMGFTTPSPIQEKTFNLVLGQDTDFIGLAATGTGKTAAFAIPLLQRVNPKVKETQALILCPTRELVMQVSNQIDQLGQFMGIRSLPIYGGAPYGIQLAGLRNNPQIIVGTPGRTIDHLKRGALKLDQVKTLILDEADEMISMGFQEDMETIMADVDGEKCNSWLFSATLGREVRRVSETYLKNPKRVEINNTVIVPKRIDQVFYMVKESNKPEILCKLIDTSPEFYGLIFCQMKSQVVDITQMLIEKGYNADSLHGDKTQAARELTLKAFRARKVQILVCTDVASRGLDIQDITHVVNFSLPRELESYVHRIGRTGRNGKDGCAMSLVSPAFRHMIPRLERVTKSKMREGRVPSRKEVAQKKMRGLLEQLLLQKPEPKVKEVLTEEWKTALEGMTAEDMLCRLTPLMMPGVFVEETAPPKAERSESSPAREYNDRGYDRGHNDRGGGYDRGQDRGRDRAPARQFSDQGFRDYDRGDRPVSDGGGNSGGGSGGYGGYRRGGDRDRNDRGGGVGNGGGGFRRRSPDQSRGAY